MSSFAVSFSYSNSDSQEVSMNINRTGNKKKGIMVRTLVQLMRRLDRIPEEVSQLEAFYTSIMAVFLHDCPTMFLTDGLVICSLLADHTVEVALL